MEPALISAIASVVVILITTAGQWLNARNDRALAHQEVELLKNLEPETRAARDLEQVIASRIDVWKFRRQPASVYYRTFAFWAVLAYLFGIVALISIVLRPSVEQDVGNSISALGVALIPMVALAICCFYAARNLRRSHDAAKGLSGKVVLETLEAQVPTRRKRQGTPMSRRELEVGRAIYCGELPSAPFDVLHVIRVVLSQTAV